MQDWGEVAVQPPAWSVYSKNLPRALDLGKILLWKLSLIYGVGEASVVVVVSVVLPSVVAGVMVSIGVDSAGVVATVVSVVVVVSVEAAGVVASRSQRVKRPGPRFRFFVRTPRGAQRWPGCRYISS